MVKKNQGSLGILPAIVEMKSSSRESTFRIRKCVVKIKRVKLQPNNTASKKTATPYNFKKCRVLIHDLSNTSSNAVSSRAILSTVPSNACEISVFEPCRNSTMYLSNTPAIIETVQPAKQQIAPQNVQIQDEKKNNGTSERVHRFFHRDQPITRTRSSVTRSVYEFLSESQIDDTELNQRKDPAADIIKKMIEDGRACAITRKKGKSRKRIVKKKVRPVGRRKQCSLKNIKEADQAELPPHIERPLSPIYEPELDSDVDNDDNNHSIEVAVQVHAPPAPSQNMSSNQHHTMFEGSYSPLARSLLLNQTKTHNTMDRRRELLHVAKKYFSTPLNQKSSTARDNSKTFSTSMHQPGNRRMAPAPVVSSPSGGASPWRVPDEAPLPNTFMFGLNTSQLPSYSSDHVRRSHVYVPDEPVPVTEPVQNNNTIICPVLDEQSIGSNANDSNGENVPPPTESVNAAAYHCLEKTDTPNALSGQENENEENLVQLPNPRRTLQQRTPLKDINILDVVMLPSWKNKTQLPKTPIKENMARNHVHFEQSIEKTINKTPQKRLSTQPPRQQRSPRNLFGFEEFLNDDEQDRGRLSMHQDITLNEKLQRLNGLRPTERELPQVSQAARRYDYDDLTARTPKQRTMKEMLCSTMVATPPPTLAVNESTDLFKDMDPEVTFDEKKPRRTYVRERPKRKRKRVHVLFIESDSSGSEDSEQDSNDKSADSPGKAVPVKKRVRRDVDNEKKLKQFITSFNQECEEVEKYSMIIE